MYFFSFLSTSVEFLRLTQRISEANADNQSPKYLTLHSSLPLPLSIQHAIQNANHIWTIYDKIEPILKSENVCIFSFSKDLQWGFSIVTFWHCQIDNWKPGICDSSEFNSDGLTWPVLLLLWILYKSTVWNPNGVSDGSTSLYFVWAGQQSGCVLDFGTSSLSNAAPLTRFHVPK